VDREASGTDLEKSGSPQGVLFFYLGTRSREKRQHIVLLVLLLPHGASFLCGLAGLFDRRSNDFDCGWLAFGSRYLHLWCIIGQVAMKRAVVPVHPVVDLVIPAFAGGGLFWFPEAIAHVDAFSFSLALFTPVVMAWRVGSFALPGIP
jgi:hypothetical protein